MATENKEKKEDYVELYIDSGHNAKDDPNEFISINGKNYILPKGEISMVPPCVKAEYERSRRAASAQRKSAKELLAKAKQPINAT
ncbi:MAG: hypothetical protein IKA62_06420 [Clostridia bacterium]|nr:hypothetical protein [Clostridia bacterium]